MSITSSPDKTTALNWSALSEVGEAAPWEALRPFAAAIAVDATLVDRLSAFYREATAKPFEEQHFEWLTVPTVFALAGPKAPLAARQAMTRTMLMALRGFDEDSDLEFEMAQMAIGRQGPAVLPLIIEELAAASPEQDGWTTLWALLELVGETREAGPRAAVRDCCEAALRSVLDGKLTHDDVTFVGHALALTGHRESAPLLEQVIATVPVSDSFLENLSLNDLKEALQNLRNPAQAATGDPFWKRSLVSVVDNFWKMSLDWRKRQDGEGDDAEDESDDENLQDDEPVAPLSAALMRDILGPGSLAIDDDELSPGKVGRNDPCPCGSGKKFKRCCIYKKSNHG